MAVLLGGISFLIVLLLFQLAVVSRLPIIYGSADLFILFLSSWALQEKSTKNYEFALIASILVSTVSALPFYIYFITYFGIIFIASVLKKRVWQTPLLALAFTILVATIMEHGLTILWLRLGGNTFPLSQTISLVSIPSILLNLLLSIPVYTVIRNIIGNLFPTESEI
jgi:hypothetical protein